MKSSTAERLQLIMKQHNYKQIDIYNKCQPFCKKYNIRLGRNDLSQYCSGKVLPGQEKLSILALALGVSEAWLMGYDVPANKSSDSLSLDEITLLNDFRSLSSDLQRRLIIM